MINSMNEVANIFLDTYIDMFGVNVALCLLMDKGITDKDFLVNELCFDEEDVEDAYFCNISELLQMGVSTESIINDYEYPPDRVVRVLKEKE